jgi:hypothetical protein
MAKLVEIRTSKINRFGKQVKYFIGEEEKIVSFNNKGIAEVSEDLLSDFLKHDKSLEIVDEDIKKELLSDKEKLTTTKQVLAANQGTNVILKDSNEKLKQENESLKERIKELEVIIELNGINLQNNSDNKIEDKKDSSSQKFTKEDLMQLGNSELYQIAEESKLPKKEWGKLKKEKIVDYLLDKLNLK